MLPPGLSARSVRMNAVPELGQHTESILSELGYVARDIQVLREKGTI